MKNHSQPFFYVLFVASILLSGLASAQTTDSIIVTGRIRNLTARLYREAPTVLVSRNNILQANRELVRPAPLNVDGTFRVSLPLIYPQEELYFNYGRISTAFLAAPGTVTIELNADSLFSVAVPFRFGGTNAQVNQQFARYKAFEAAYPDKPSSKKLSELIANQSDNTAFNTLVASFQTPFVKFSEKEKPFPLVTQWVMGNNRYNAAAFLYDKASFESTMIPTSMNSSLRPPDYQLLTAARASSMNRFASYVTERISTDATQQTNGLTVRALSLLLERYGKNITAEERLRLHDYATTNTARAADLRFFDGLVKRSPDTLQRLVNYETMIQRSIRKFDSTDVNYLAAYWLANSLPGLTLDFARLLYDYARPQVKDPQLAKSLDELYGLEVKDSTRIRAAMQTLRKAGNRTSNLEISPSVFITRDDLGNGSSLFDQVVNTNRGKVIYLLLTSASDEAGRQAAFDAQRLRSVYSSRDFALVYLPMPGTNSLLWPELATRYNLSGDHLLLTDSQLMDAIERLRSDNELSATVINRTGKIVKRNAPLPGELEEVRKVLDKNL
ncbi:hypothetical protein [Spirosoma validum]|uniref:Thioredoxin domain-containing protein n=1 Tax=Spirosoma validum TaxID=2771355 RepID=A0A927GD63_9BACT|nr:hypothetical protein [Spirosoma validum]MBD2753221.1 hypothetical protein [Spirosoma validum]